MLTEFQTHLSNWNSLDTAIVLTAAVAAMTCALPGVWLVLRRQSMMGDALAHTALPGVVIAFLTVHWFEQSHFFNGTIPAGLIPVTMGFGAVLIGVLTAVLTEWIQRLGRVDSGAALGVVYTSFFALGLLLTRRFADDVHIDPDCVLLGQLELIVFDSITIAGFEVPKAMLLNGAVLLLNLGLMFLFYKELRLAAFDPEMATAIGVNARWCHYALMASTAVTVVMAFQSVGSILVIGLLVTPAATSLLLTNRLWLMVVLSLVLAALSAFVGHVMAKTLPAMMFGRLGFPQVEDAGTSGMVAVACGLFFVLAFLFSPHHGLFGKWLGRMRLTIQITSDDFLSTIFRYQERSPGQAVSQADIRKETAWITPLTSKFTLWSLVRRGLIDGNDGGYSLTKAGFERAAGLVQSHRLWEAYMQKHFEIPDDHLHDMAHYVEHYLDADLREELFRELESPDQDPHGRAIPGTKSSGASDQ